MWPAIHEIKRIVKFCGILDNFWPPVSGVARILGKARHASKFFFFSLAANSIVLRPRKKICFPTPLEYATLVSFLTKKIIWIFGNHFFSFKYIALLNLCRLNSIEYFLEAENYWKKKLIFLQFLHSVELPMKSTGLKFGNVCCI